MRRVRLHGARLKGERKHTPPGNQGRLPVRGPLLAEIRKMKGIRKWKLGREEEGNTRKKRLHGQKHGGGPVLATNRVLLSALT